MFILNKSLFIIIRQNETTEQANNRKRIAAEKMAEKRKLETPEQANIWKRKDAEKMAEKRKLETPQQENIWKRKVAEKKVEQRKLETSQHYQKRIEKISIMPQNPRSIFPLSVRP